MSQNFLRGSLTATLAIASLGVAIPTVGASMAEDRLVGEDVPQVQEQDGDRPPVFTLDALEPFISSTSAASESATKVGRLQTPSQTRLNDVAIATLYAHDMDGRSAATVYVRNLPTFTFLAPEDTDAPSSPQADAIVASDDDLDATDPVVRATVLTSQLNQYFSEGLAADAITVRWNDDTEEVVVEADGTTLLVMDELVILPDTTGKATEDALQATNRLRRQFGGAEALTAIAGLPSRPVVRRSAQATFSGMASWYGPGFHGRMSASGERFNQNAMTAAHRTLPFGTVVEVTNLNTGATAIVRINDRGPFSHGRVIDLSAAAARAIGMMGSGVAPVSVIVLE